MLTTIVALSRRECVFAATIAFEARPAPSAAPTLQLGILSEPLSGDLAVAAKAWALTNRGRLGLHPASTLTFDVGFATHLGAAFALPAARR